MHPRCAPCDLSMMELLSTNICMHSNHTPSFTVSKLGSDRSIPLVESVDTGSSSIGIQYDLDSQLRSDQPAPIHQRRSKVLATEVTLRLNKFKLQLYAIKDKLNSTSAFSIVMPNQWRACTGHRQLSHYGKISILSGGDNFHTFPKEQDRNSM